eukprot:5074129-Prymnesium_polylepis.1
MSRFPTALTFPRSRRSTRMSAHCTVSCRTVRAFSRFPFLHTEGCHPKASCAAPHTQRAGRGNSA